MPCFGYERQFRENLLFGPPWKDWESWEPQNSKIEMTSHHELQKGQKLQPWTKNKLEASRMLGCLANPLCWALSMVSHTMATKFDGSPRVLCDRVAEKGKGG